MTYEELEFRHAQKNNLLGDDCCVLQDDGGWLAQTRDERGTISLTFVPNVDEPQPPHPAEAVAEICPECGEYTDYCECVCANCGGFVGLNCRCEYNDDRDDCFLFDEDCECTDCDECQEEE